MSGKEKRNMKKENVPTLERILKLQEQSQVCGEFLTWLQKKYAMFERKISRKEPVYYGTGDYINTEKVLAEFFNIDLEEAEAEKEQLLRKVRNENV